jgi:hypothetical protein
MDSEDTGCEDVGGILLGQGRKEWQCKHGDMNLATEV